MSTAPAKVRTWNHVVPEADPREFARMYHQMADEAADDGGVCYFIGGDKGFIKIGWSKWPEDRLASIYTCSPIPLRIMATRGGGLHREQAYHAQFHHLRQHGEWFKRSSALMREINRLANRVVEL